MKTRLLTTLAGAALITGCSLALAQTMESTPGGSNGAQGSSQREPGGAARERQPGAMQSPAQRRSGAIEDREHRSSQSGAMQSPAQGRSGRSVGSTTFSADQRTRLHTVIAGGDVRRINNADFSLSVGTRVPNTVTFYDLPETIVDIFPEYRGYDYIVVRDELVIIDPETLEIVAVLPA